MSILFIFLSFARAFGTPKNDWAYCTQQTFDGGYICAGGTDIMGRDFLVIKTDPKGNIVWSKTYGGTSAECAYSVSQTFDNGYVVGGLTNPGSAGLTDILVIKLDSIGNLLWAKTYGGVKDEDYMVSIKQTKDGGYIIGSRSQSFGNGSADFLVIKLDSLGNISWNLNIVGGYEAHDGCHSVFQLGDGNYITAGYTYSFGNFCDAYVIKLTPSGCISWAKTYGTSGGEWVHSIKQTEDNGYILGCQHSNSSTWQPPFDFLIIKLDSSGNILWNKNVDGGKHELLNDIEQSYDGGYIEVGTTYSFGVNSDFFIVKFDPAGNFSWAKTFIGINYDELYSVQKTASDEYLIGGCLSSFGEGEKDVALFRFSPSDSSSVCLNNCFPSVTSLGLIQTTVSPCIIYPAISVASASLMIAPINLIQTDSCVSAGISETGFENVHSSIKIIPGVGKNMVIKYSVSGTISKYVEISFYDMAGRCVKKLFSGFKNPGDYNINANMGTYCSGTYLCKIRLGEKVFVKKFILL